MEYPKSNIIRTLYDYRWVTVWVAVGILALTMWAGWGQRSVLQLQEAELAARRKATASVVGIGIGLTLKPDPTGADWIYSEVTFRNISENYTAKNIRILYQFFGAGSWTGFFKTWTSKKGGPPKETIDLEPGEKFTAIMQSQTADNPIEKCMNGERFFLAMRNDWENPNGELGCKISFVELSCHPGIGPGPRNQEMLTRAIPRERLADVEQPPAIWPCQEQP